MFAARLRRFKPFDLSALRNLQSITLRWAHNFRSAKTVVIVLERWDLYAAIWSLLVGTMRTAPISLNHAHIVFDHYDDQHPHAEDVRRQNLRSIGMLDSYDWFAFGASLAHLPSLRAVEIDLTLPKRFNDYERTSVWAPYDLTKDAVLDGLSAVQSATGAQLAEKVRFVTSVRDWEGIVKEKVCGCVVYRPPNNQLAEEVVVCEGCLMRRHGNA